MRCRLNPIERFDVVTQRHGDSTRQALQIQCVACDAKGHFNSTGRAWPPTEHVLQRFERDGWTMHPNSRRFDKCPDCSAKPKTAKPKTESPVSSAPTESNVTQLRAPTMADRRRILDALQEIYDPAKQAYSKDWTDDAIAKKLDLPRAWIADIRGQFFGPDMNEATQTARAELVDWLAKLKDIEDRALALAGEAEAARKQIAALMRAVA